MALNKPTRKCKLDGCRNVKHTRGWCKTHSNQIKRGEEPRMTDLMELPKDGMLPRKAKITQSLLDSRSKQDSNTGCKLWQGTVHPSGYGKVRRKRVHRLAYELAHGQIPDGMTIDHICHVKACINTEHLRMVTQTQNSQNLKLNPRNTTGMRGVRYIKTSGTWRTGVTLSGKEYSTGTYGTFEEACEAVVELRARLYTHHIEEFSTVRADS